MASLNLEEPYNHYGSRGVLDILHYHRLNDLIDGSGELLAIYEIKPRIYNLNETLRQITTYSEYGIQHFKKTYDNRPVDAYWTHLVLLNTKENCDLILNFQNSFASIFKNAPGWENHRAFLIKNFSCYTNPSQLP